MNTSQAYRVFGQVLYSPPSGMSKAHQSCQQPPKSDTAVFKHVPGTKYVNHVGFLTSKEAVPDLQKAVYAGPPHHQVDVQRRALKNHKEKKTRKKTILYTQTKLPDTRYHITLMTFEENFDVNTWGVFASGTFFRRQNLHICYCVPGI